MTFVKGQSGNPKGRPPTGKTWGDVLKRIGEEPIKPNDPNAMEKKEAVARKLWQEAAKGEAWAVNALMDRMDGKPRQVAEVDHTTNGKDMGAMPMHSFIDTTSRDE